MPLLAMEDAMCGMRMICWILNTVTHPSTSACHISSTTERLYERAAWRTVCDFIYNQCRVCNRGQTSPSTVFTMRAMQDCVHSLVCDLWQGMKEKIYATEVWVCYDLVNHIQVTDADFIPGQLFFVRTSILFTMRHLFRWREDTSNSFCDYQSADKSSPHEH